MKTMQSLFIMAICLFSVKCFAGMHPHTSAPFASTDSFGDRPLHLGHMNRIMIHRDVTIPVKIIGESRTSDIRIVGMKQTDPMLYIYEPALDHSTLIVRQPNFIRDDFDENTQPMIIIRTRHKIRELFYGGRGPLMVENLVGSRLTMKIDTDSPVTVNSKKLDLRHLIVEGYGTVNIQEVHSPKLTITQKENSTVHIQGQANLQKLNFSGDGELHFFWIDSPLLRIRGSGNAVAKLAGKAGTLDIKLQDKAHLDARYVNAEKGYIKAFDHARADVSLDHLQHAGADNNANIYYYDHPAYRMDHMYANAAILSLHHTDDIN